MALNKQVRSTKLKEYPNIQYIQTGTSRVFVNRAPNHGTSSYKRDEDNAANDMRDTNCGNINDISDDYSSNIPYTKIDQDTDIQDDEYNASMKSQHESDKNDIKYSMASKLHEKTNASSSNQVQYTKTNRNNRIQRAFTDTYTIPSTNEVLYDEKYVSNISSPNTCSFDNELVLATIQRNRKLESIVRKLVTKQQREKHTESWNNFINNLKNKHRYSNTEPTTISPPLNENNTYDFIDDFYNRRFRQNSYSLVKLLNEVFGVQANIRANDMFKYRHSYDNVLPPAKDQCYESNSYCYPICSQPRLILVKRENPNNSESSNRHNRSNRSSISDRDSINGRRQCCDYRDCTYNKRRTSQLVTQERNIQTERPMQRNKTSSTMPNTSDTQRRCIYCGSSGMGMSQSDDDAEVPFQPICNYKRFIKDVPSDGNESPSKPICNFKTATKKLHSDDSICIGSELYAHKIKPERQPPKKVICKCKKNKKVCNDCKMKTVTSVSECPSYVVPVPRTGGQMYERPVISKPRTLLCDCKNKSKRVLCVCKGKCECICNDTFDDDNDTQPVDMTCGCKEMEKSANCTCPEETKYKNKREMQQISQCECYKDPLYKVEQKLDALIQSFNMLALEMRANNAANNNNTRGHIVNNSISSSDISNNRSKPMNQRNQVVYSNVLQCNENQTNISEINDKVPPGRCSCCDSLDKIIEEEKSKSEKIRKDIDELLHIKESRQCSVQIGYEIPMKEISTEVTKSFCKAQNASKETLTIEEIDERRSRDDQRFDQMRNMTIAVNTDPLGLFALLRVSAEAVKQFLSYLNYYPRITMGPRQPCSYHYVCTICGAAFSRPSHLSTHIQRHDLGRTRDGAVCSRVIDHPRHPQGLFKCQYCGQSFVRAYCCELHQQTCAKRQGRQHDVNTSLSLLK